MPAVSGRPRLRKLKRYRQILSKFAFYGCTEAVEAVPPLIPEDLLV